MVGHRGLRQLLAYRVWCDHSPIGPQGVNWGNKIHGIFQSHRWCCGMDQVYRCYSLVTVSFSKDGRRTVYECSRMSVVEALLVGLLPIGVAIAFDPKISDVDFGVIKVHVHHTRIDHGDVCSGDQRVRMVLL